MLTYQYQLLSTEDILLIVKTLYVLVRPGTRHTLLTIKVAKILPRGSERLPAESVGVHRKTKVNMEAWNRKSSYLFLKAGFGIVPQQELALYPVSEL